MQVIDRNRDAGFTLLEVLLVLAIAAGLMAVVVPNIYKSISGAQLSKSTRQLASSLRSLRTQAIHSTRSTALSLNVDDRSYRMSSKAGAIQLPQDIDLSLTTGARLLAGAGEGVVLFFADGSSSGGRISLRKGEKAYQIDINWLTGEVNIEAEDA